MKQDYTEETEGVKECFVVRFKTSQLVEEFMNVFQMAVGEFTQATLKSVPEGTNASKLDSVFYLRGIFVDIGCNFVLN